MKIINCRVVILIFCCLFISCENKKVEPVVEQIESTHNPADNYNQLNKSKFLYIEFTVNEPILKIDKGIDTSIFGDDAPKIEDSYTVEWKTKIYKSEIKEIGIYDEEAKYKLLDEYESEIKTQLGLKNMVYKDNLMIKCKDDEARELLNDKVCEIIDRQVYSFDRYSDASKNRQLD